jgi:hypothetical protein
MRLSAGDPIESTSQQARAIIKQPATITLPAIELPTWDDCAALLSLYQETSERRES